MPKKPINWGMLAKMFGGYVPLLRRDFLYVCNCSEMSC